MFDRRRLLLAAAASATAAALPFPAAAAVPGSGPKSAKGARLDALLDAFFQEQLQSGPEGATELGLDKGANAGLKRRLADVSETGWANDRAANADRIKRLKAIGRDGLTGVDRINYDTVLYVEEATAPIMALGVGGLDGFSPSPYVLSPITGAYQRVPVFLDTKHSIETAADADAYLSRMSAFAGAVDANTARFKADTARGIVPPDFLLDTTLKQLGDLIAPAEKAGMVQSIGRRAEAKGLGGDWRARATRIYASEILPALERQSAALKQARAGAVHDAGIGRFKDGPAFYAANLRYTTTTTMSPEEVHKLGLDQAAEIGARLDVLLRKHGLTQGTVGQRIQALYKDPAQYYPNTEAGKAELIADLQKKLEVVKARLPQAFNHIPNQQIEARRVPPAIDSGSPLAYSEGAPLDRSRPGYIYFNLHDTAEWPRWNLPSTLYHEGLPGHQLQGGIAQESQGIPILRRNMYFSGYGEGWALYAEQLADELGMYEDDPLGRIGWLKAQIFRAGRCVVDTGMHHMGWSREKAIEYLMGLDGDAVGSTTREVERYCAIPAQACSYKIGHTVWNQLRDRARAQLGPRFDIKAFHDAGLLTGAMPLDVLSDAIDGYVAGARSVA